jgi:hypothetical protein
MECLFACAAVNDQDAKFIFDKLKVKGAVLIGSVIDPVAPIYEFFGFSTSYSPELELGPRISSNVLLESEYIPSD